MTVAYAAVAAGSATSCARARCRRFRGAGKLRQSRFRDAVADAMLVPCTAVTRHGPVGRAGAWPGVRQGIAAMLRLISTVLCLLGFHRYELPTRDGGMRCRCRRVRYLLL